MKYLIKDMIENRFRTITSWIKEEKDLLEGEKMLSFDTRKEADELIRKHYFNCCQSWAIGKDDPLYKHCRFNQSALNNFIEKADMPQTQNYGTQTR